MKACAATGGVVNISGAGMLLGHGADGKRESMTEAIVRHIDYAVQLIGPRHVGLGLDYVFDLSEFEEFVRKSPEVFPSDLKHAGGYAWVEPENIPAIAETLLKRGYSEPDVQGIMGYNNLRVAREVWK